MFVKFLIKNVHKVNHSIHNSILVYIGHLSSNSNLGASQPWASIPCST